MFIELLFNDFIRFIGSDYTPLSVEEVTEASIACCVKQEIHGDYAINTYISMDLDTAIAFATRYVHEQFHSYDESGGFFESAERIIHCKCIKHL